MADEITKSGRDKLDELYEDWFGPHRPEDKHLAFRTRFITIEEWVKDQKKAEELKKAEAQGKQYLTKRVVEALRFVGFSGLLILIGYGVRLYNAWNGGGQ